MIKKFIIYPAIGLFTIIVAVLLFQIAVALIGKMTPPLTIADSAKQEYALGPNDADVSLVEFAIYTCPHCRDIHATILEAVQKDGNVRYIPRPLPSQTVEAAQMAYAAGEQDKFMMTHSALLTDGRILDEGGLMTIAQSVGLDTKRLQQDMTSASIIDQVNENIDIFNSFGGTRTPTFVINNETIFVPEGQMPTVDSFLKMFEEARQ